ncbi:MAG: isochorismatase family protein [Candidatus Heimdallarchaeota archaeon]
MEYPHASDIMEPSDRSSRLIKAQECLVLIIDVQEPFLKGLTAEDRTKFLKKHIWLIQLCGVLEIPYILTAEDIAKNGSIETSLESQVQKEAKDPQIFDKFIYSCWGQTEIRDTIKSTGRPVIVLAGLETDVCIMQSALDLLDHGYRVVVLVDLTYSRNEFEHSIGIRRMESHGAIVSTLKSWQEEVTGGLKTRINHLLTEKGLTEIPQ